MKTYILQTSGLLSKWGFLDGDIFDDFLEDNGSSCAMEVSHKFLEKVIKELVIPKLTNKVDLVFVQTIHNPIRAQKVDDIEVCWTNINPDIHFSIDSVTITEDELMKILNK